MDNEPMILFSLGATIFLTNAFGGTQAGAFANTRPSYILLGTVQGQGIKQCWELAITADQYRTTASHLYMALSV